MHLIYRIDKRRFDYAFIDGLLERCLACEADRGRHAKPGRARLLNSTSRRHNLPWGVARLTIEASKAEPGTGCRSQVGLFSPGPDRFQKGAATPGSVRVSMPEGQRRAVVGLRSRARMAARPDRSASHPPSLKLRRTRARRRSTGLAPQF